MIYLVLSALCLALLYGVYRLALSRTTLHRFNRIMLLSIIGISAVLPAIRISGIGAIGATGAIGDSPLLHVRELAKEEAFSGSKGDSPQLSAEYNEVTYTPIEIEEEPVWDVKTSVATGVKVVEAATQMDWVMIITYLYLIGVAFFMIRLLIGITRAETLCRLGGRELPDGSKLLVCDGEFQPTSWRHTVIMSRRDYESTEKDIIIEHELTHIHCHHSIDVVIAQITCALQWFNPAAWALKRSLQEVHEYEADANVLADGENERRYQICLVQAALNAKIGYVTSNFADCSTKKRIKMMRTNQSSPFACLRAIFMLPVVLVTILLASACKPKTAQGASVKTSDPVLEESVPKSVPYDTLAFLKGFGYGQNDEDIRVKQLNHFITVEADGSVWFNIAGQDNYERASLSNLAKEFESAKSRSTVEVADPEKVYVMYNKENRMGICAEVIKQLQNSYKDENIVLTREPYIKSVPPAPDAMIDLKKDNFIIVTINDDNEISFAGQWFEESGMKSTIRSETPIPSDNIRWLRAYINSTISEPDKTQGLKANLRYDLSCSGRVKKEVEKIIREYVKPPYLTYQVPYDLSSLR